MRKRNVRIGKICAIIGIVRVEIVNAVGIQPEREYPPAE